MSLAYKLVPLLVRPELRGVVKQCSDYDYEISQAQATVLYGDQADDHDKGQHHSIFNCRGAFFRGQKIVDSFPKGIHVSRLFGKYCDMRDTHSLQPYVTPERCPSTHR